MSPLYKVRLSYAVQVSAVNMEEAHAKVAKMIAASPEGFISGVESATAAKPGSLLGRIITGK